MGCCRMRDGTYHADGFSDDEDESLICYCARGGEEKEGERDVKERQGGYDRCGRYERHVVECF